jgi:hypothetical protein
LPGVYAGVGQGVTNSHAPGTLAEEMANLPEVWRRLLATHVADRHGRCAACRDSSGPGERWPCSLYSVAEEAQRVHSLRLGRAVAGG